MLLQLVNIHNQKINVSFFFLRNCHSSLSGWVHCQQNFWNISIIKEPCCCSIDGWACWANWAFCICWVWFSISRFISFSSSFWSSCFLSDFSAKKFMVPLVLLHVFFSDSALRYLVSPKVLRDFFLFLAPWPDLLPSSRFSLQIIFSFLSQPHRIVESIQIKHHLFMCALGWYHSLFLPHSIFFFVLFHK